MENNMPFIIPNFMPYNPNNIEKNNNIERQLETITHELENIEKTLSRIENKIDIKSSSYLTSNVDNDKGLYMI